MRAASTPLLGLLLILIALVIVFSIRAMEDRYVAVVAEARSSLQLKGDAVIHEWDLITSERVFMARKMAEELNYRDISALDRLEDLIAEEDFLLFLYNARNMLAEFLDVLEYRSGEREISVVLWRGFPLVTILQKGEMDMRLEGYMVTVKLGERTYLLPINVEALKEEAERFLEELSLPEVCVYAESRKEAKEQFGYMLPHHCKPIVSRKGEALFVLVGVTCNLPLRAGPYTVVLRLSKARSTNKCLGTDM